MQHYSFDTVTSTQDIAKAYVTEGHDLPFVVHAENQTRGRGRSGNLWVSQKGNLLASIVVPLPPLSLKKIGQYSFVTAVSLMDILGDYGVTHAVNKWPNDILVDGKKIAGILLESESGIDGLSSALIIGVGVNLTHAPEGAVSLRDYVGSAPCIDVMPFLNDFIFRLKENIQHFEKNGFSIIRQRWLDKAYGIGTTIKIRLPHETFHGVFMGLDDDGALLVTLDGGALRKVYAGDVFFA